MYKDTEYKVDGAATAELVITKKDGEETRLHVFDYNENGGVVLSMYNTDDSISSFARSCFNYALDTKQDLWFATKDTISSQYDHRFKDIFAEIFEAEYKEKFEKAQISISIH